MAICHIIAWSRQIFHQDSSHNAAPLLIPGSKLAGQPSLSEVKPRVTMKRAVALPRRLTDPRRPMFHHDQRLLYRLGNSSCTDTARPTILDTPEMLPRVVQQSLVFHRRLFDRCLFMKDFRLYATIEVHRESSTYHHPHHCYIAVI